MTVEELRLCHDACKPQALRVGEVDPKLLRSLYKRGLIYLDVPILPDDHVSIPPLEVGAPARPPASRTLPVPSCCSAQACMLLHKDILNSDEMLHMRYPVFSRRMALRTAHEGLREPQKHLQRRRYAPEELFQGSRPAPYGPSPQSHTRILWCMCGVCCIKCDFALGQNSLDLPGIEW